MHDFIVLLIPGAHATSVAATLDMLSAAALLARRVGCPVPRWTVVSASGGDVALGNGVSVTSQVLPARLPSGRPTWIVPGLGATSARRAEALLSDAGTQAVLRVLRRAAARGGSIAASCSAVLLLGGAGLLDGRRVTISWWLAPLLRRMVPACQVDEMRMVIEDGPIVTAGAAFAQIDLMLWLLRRRFGQALSEAVARALLIDGRQLQGPYIDPSVVNAGHELLMRIEAQVRAALPHPPSVEALAATLAMSPRTLTRRVRTASGRSPLELVQSVRLASARALLESGGLSVEEVAHRVGYQDATALRRLMKKAYGATPRQMRPTAVPDA
ncbi:helix-turn-helix domain-containing protein [Schlegelella sp. S2-27]|uniref:Helix-turn-helix domain-containing protein n=1 Tax=Caldimonas mangrovi TaxID=2944811 RepID=A0ABT0YVT8_9BURK|nr:helix-turn-helix domain-containing protein [Caldimonas mangrovi]MCM5682865.1 helix-turn-helix domain-containing protein [Caldimonas mangrovi]